LPELWAKAEMGGLTMDIKTRIDAMTEQEAKAALVQILNTVIAMHKGFLYELKHILKEVRK
jgi:hypothetical protein